MSSLSLNCFKSFIIFLSLIYFPGLFFFPFFEEGYQSYYNFESGLYSSFFVNFILFNLLTFIIFYYFSRFPKIKFPTISSKLVINFVLILSVFTFFLSIYFSINFSSKFRHVNRLSDAGVSVALLFFLKPILYFIVCLMLIHILNGAKLGVKSRVSLYLILILSVLSINSSLQVIIIILILLMLFYPSVFLSRKIFLSFRYFLLIFLLLPILTLSVLFIGIGNKVGYDFLLTTDGFYFIKNYGNILFPRMSTSLFSSVIMLQNSLDGHFYTNETLNAIFSTLYNRLSLIFPLDNFNTSLIDTVNRLNYTAVFSNHADRAGASPGIIASVFYTPLFPFLFFAIPMYVYLIYSSLSYHMNSNVNLNIISSLSLPYLILNLFESPLNIFYLLDPIAFLFFCVVFIGRFINVQRTFVF
jgi:hypothetical protein